MNSRKKAERAIRRVEMANVMVRGGSVRDVARASGYSERRTQEIQAQPETQSLLADLYQESRERLRAVYYQVIDTAEEGMRATDEEGRINYAARDKAANTGLRIIDLVTPKGDRNAASGGITFNTLVQYIQSRGPIAADAGEVIDVTDESARTEGQSNEQ